jgi:ABC-type uncharacterized transport system ATPase component
LIRKIFSADMRLFFKGTPPHQRDTFDHKVIEVEDSLYLAGANGAGKSSVLDAMQGDARAL